MYSKFQFLLYYMKKIILLINNLNRNHHGLETTQTFLHFSIYTAEKFNGFKVWEEMLTRP